MHPEELKELITAKLDVTEFLDILGYDLYDIIDKFEEEIHEHESTFVSVVT